MPGTSVSVLVSAEEFCGLRLSPFTLGLSAATQVIEAGNDDVMGIFKVTPLQALMFPLLVILGSGKIVTIILCVSRQIPPVMITV